MGFSRGGQAALFASLNRFHQAWNKSRIEFAAYIVFYPDCMTTYQSDTEVADRPIRIFMALRMTIIRRSVQGLRRALTERGA
jgi:hypothetical protein